MKCENCPYIEHLKAEQVERNAQIAELYGRVNLKSMQAQAQTILAEAHVSQAPDSDTKRHAEEVLESLEVFFDELPSVVNDCEDLMEVLDEAAENFGFWTMQYCESGPIQKRTLLGGMILRCGSSIVDKADGTKRIR